MKRSARIGAILVAVLAATAAQAVNFSLVSLRSDGTPPSVYGDSSDPPAITPNGRYVVFTASATNLVTPNAIGAQIYLRDRVAGTTELVSVNMTGGGGDNASSAPSVSDDGCRVVFTSLASDLVAGDSASTNDVFVRDRCTQPATTSLVSVSTNGTMANARSIDGRISGDGSKVVFVSDATNLVSMTGAGFSCLFLRDLNAHTTTAITTASGACIAANGPDPSRDASRVAFWAYTVPGTSNPVNSVWQIYVYDFNAAAGTQPVVVSTSALGAPQTQGAEGASTITLPAISADGGYVAFRSRGAGLVTVDGGGFSHVYIKELSTGAILRASVDSAGNPGNGDSSGSGQGYRPGISLYANVVTFVSSAANLAPETGGIFPNVVAHNPYTGQTVGFTSTQNLTGMPAITAGGDIIVAYSGYALDPAYASRGLFAFGGMATQVADVSVTQSPAPNPAGVGKDLVYTLTVANAGPSVATGVTLTDALPAGSTFVWATPGCANASGTVTCTIGTLGYGASTLVKLVVRPSAAGVATNNATVSRTEIDPNSANDSSSSTITVNTTPVAMQALRYRLYSPVTLEHHFTTDLNEYNVLGSYVGTWNQEGTVGKVLNNPGSFGGVTATPYYRLYDTSTQWHHWTTDANEYYTLIQFPSWNAEGVDGYILPTTTTGATQLYRLLYPFIPGLHHWTIDPTEYGILISTYGWIGEGGAGFVIQ